MALNQALKKALTESHSDENHEIFNRVERRFHAAKLAKLTSELRDYRKTAKDKSFFALSTEPHSSAKLGEFLRTVMPRPGARWEAHHIVSGEHPEAEQARAVLADIHNKIRIDDPDNGCWMPKTKADARPTLFPNAIGHNRIHRESYYEWIFNRIVILDDDLAVRAFLNTVRQQLLDGNIHNHLLVQEEIDHAEYKDWLKKTK